MPELNNQNFNHLKIHTQYSICEGAIKIDNLKDFCKEKKYLVWVFQTHLIYVVH